MSSFSYRFRLVSLSCDPFYTFSIDGHNMTIIEADAVNTKPHTVDSLEIFAGQRYSFIVRCCVIPLSIMANPASIGLCSSTRISLLTTTGSGPTPTSGMSASRTA